MVESGEIFCIIGQVTTLANESQDVSLEVRQIEKLQLVWRDPVSLTHPSADSTYPSEYHKQCQTRRSPWVSPLGSDSQGQLSTGRQRLSLADWQTRAWPRPVVKLFGNRQTLARLHMQSEMRRRVTTPSTGSEFACLRLDLLGRMTKHPPRRREHRPSGR